MNRLAVAFAVICLLQGLSAVPRPEYGLAVTIKNSDQITDTVAAIRPTIITIAGISITAPTSGFTKLTTLKTQIDNVLVAVSTNTNPILTAYDSLQSATDGDINAAFSGFLSAIDSATGYLTSVTAANIISAIDTLEYEGISDQLEDAYGRILNGLTTLKQAALAVKEGISNALAENDGNPNVPADILTANIPVIAMYGFVRAARDLKAYLPLVEYILTTVEENIETADGFVNSFSRELGTQTGNNINNFLQRMNAATSDFVSTVRSDLLELFSIYEDVRTDVDDLAGISGASDYSALLTTLSSFQAAFSSGTISPPLSNLAAGLSGIGSSQANLLSSLLATVVPVEDELIQLLVNTLVGNLEYGRYCYYKYKDVIFNIITEGFGGGSECVDREIVRLLHLQDTLLLIIELLIFDSEGITEEVGACSRVASDTPILNGCITTLKAYYSTLLSKTYGKRDLIYTLIEREGIAIKNRLLICTNAAFIEARYGEVGDFVDDLEICAADGPNGAD